MAYTIGCRHTDPRKMLKHICLLLVVQLEYTRGFHNQNECPDSNWQDLGRYCYLYHMDSLSFEAAEMHCMQNGSHLASVHSLAQHFQLIKVAEDEGLGDYWIGLKDVVIDMSGPSGVWTDGTDYDYDRWDNTEPDGTSQCTYVNDNDGYWYERTCTVKYNSMCQYDKECGGILTSPGTIASPGYQNNAHCSWYITAPQSSIIQLNITILSIVCDFDYLQIYNGVFSESPPLSEKLCGNASTASYTTTTNDAAVVFITDGIGSEAGFEITVTFPTGDDCWSEIKSTEFNASGPVTASSPNYNASGYSSDLQCIWKIIDDDGFGSASINFIALELEDQGHCIYDYVKVWQGLDENAELVGVYCDSQDLPRIVLPTPDIFLTFVSNEDVEANGFSFEVAFYECGGILTTPGTIASANYTGNYNANESCAWQIEANVGEQIQLTFSTDFGIDGSSPCTLDSDDYLEIFDGPHPTSRLLGKFCGSVTPGNITSQTNRMLLVFYSNMQDVDQGFQLNFTFITDGIAPCKSTTELDTAIVQLPMEDITEEGIQDGTYTLTVVNGSASLVPGVIGTALLIDDSVVFSLGSRQSDCFFDPSLCSTGATLSLWIQFIRDQDEDYEMLQVLSSGGQTSESYGLSVFMDLASNGNGLVVDVTSKTKWVTLVDFSWSQYPSAKENVWTHLVISWDETGATLYENGKFVKHARFQNRTVTIETSLYEEFIIGLPNDQLDTDYFKGRGIIDELLFWDSPKDAEFVSTIYQSYEDDRAVCVHPYVCVNGECVCSNEVFGCGTTVIITSSIESQETLQEGTTVQLDCDFQTQQPFTPELLYNDDQSTEEVFVAAENETTITHNISLNRTHHGVSFFCRASSTENATIFIDSETSYTYYIEYGPDNIIFTADKPQNMSYSENTNADFTCTVQANPVPVLSLFTSDQGGNQTTVYQQDTPGLSFSVSVLLIKEYNGISFFCNALQDNTSSVSDNAIVYEITYPASAVALTSSIPDNSNVMEHTEVTLECAADSNPPPELFILFNDGGDIQQLSSATGLNLTLTINLTREYNGAAIYCEARGVDPNFIVASQDYAYTVTYGPDNIIFTADKPQNMSYSENTNADFTCTVQANPVPVLSLFTSDQGGSQTTVYQQDTPGLSFSVSVLLIKEYNGISFFCNALQDNTSSVSNNAIVYEITYPASAVALTSSIPDDSNVMEHIEVALECAADSNPPPELFLLFNDGGVIQQISSTTGSNLTLAITLTREYNGAAIYCEARGADPNFIVASQEYVYTVTYGPDNIVFTADKPHNMSYSENTNADFTCTVQANPVPVLSLFTSDQNGNQTTVYQQNTPGQSFTVSVLLIKEYNGISFFCKALQDNTSSVSDNAIGYEITYPASAVTMTSSIPDNSNVMEHTEVTLECAADSNPPPELFILFNDGGDIQQISSTTGLNLTLTINLTREYNGAAIYCEARGADPNFIVASQDYVYTVTYTPFNIEFNSSISTGTTIEVGTQVTFTCSVDSLPIATLSLITISVIEKEIVLKKSNSLVVSVVLAAEDNGLIFMCRAISSDPEYSINSSQTISFNVIYPATDVTLVSSVPDNSMVLENTEVTLECTVDSNPLPDLIMLFNNGGNIQTIASSTGVNLTLTINLTRDYSGAVIYCEASGTDPNVIVDSVHYVYTIKYAASHVEFNSSLSRGTTVQDGTEVTFTCTTDSFPTATLSLIKLSETEQEISQNTGNSWTVSVILTKEDNWFPFICRATGSDPVFSVNSAHTYNFSVEFAPSSIHLSISPDNNVTVGTIVTITCVTDVSNPVLDITWTQDGENISSSSHTAVSGQYNAEYATSNLSFQASLNLTHTQYGCHVGIISDFITLYVTPSEMTTGPTEIPTAAPLTDNSLRIGLGILGGIVSTTAVVGAAVSVLIIITKSSSGGLSQFQKPPMKSYIPRGIRGKLTYRF